MRKSKSETAESRRRIVESAARALRARGLAGASVAEVMAEAGMTHGGFYKHFASKADMLDAAARASFDEIAAGFDAVAAKEGAPAAAAGYARDYLSRAHLAHPERGCPVAAFGAEAGREPQTLAPAFADGVEKLIARIQSGGTPRRQAIRKLARLVGAVVAARAVGEGALADEIVAACE